MIRLTRVWGVLPVKTFATAKRRLSAVLEAPDREALACAMFEDVLAALVHCKSLEGVMVVTADNQASAIASASGALVLAEPSPIDLNAALLHATTYLADVADTGIVVVPADIPQLSPDAVECAVENLNSPSAVALARSSDGGTNLLACRPPDVIQPHFGTGSFDAHCAAARRAGLEAHVIEWPALELDLDRPGDLVAFLSLRTKTRTHTSVLHALSRGIISRAIVSI